MIDYDKLKQKVEYLETGLRDLRWLMNEVCNHLSMNEEPTKPDPKYKVNDTLFGIGYNQDIREEVVESISNGKETYGYHFKDPFFSAWEYELFPTRLALIEHQIQYWRVQLANELEQHVSSYCEPKTCRFEMPTCNAVDHYWINGHRVCCDDIKSNQPQVDDDRCHRCNVSLASNGQCGNLDCVDRCQPESKLDKIWNQYIDPFREN